MIFYILLGIITILIFVWCYKMIKNWNKLKEKCLECNRCNLSDTRHNVVFGAGNELSKILFVGEAPGENEDKKGEPFVGRGGKLLDQMLQNIGLDRAKNIYIANIVKCRPPENRDPSKIEQTQCIDWLEEQIDFIKPKIIVCLGRVAAIKLIKKDLKITKEHGMFFEKNNCVFMPTFHPAALLRNPLNKPSAIEDFKKLKNKINKLNININ